MTSRKATNKVRVLHVTTVPQTLLRIMSGLIDFQKRLGYSVSAACSAGTWVKAERVAQALGIEVSQLPLERRIRPFHDLLALFRLTILMLRQRPQIVHSHTPKGGLLGGLAGWLTARPIRLYTVRGSPYITARGATRAALLISEFLACACAKGVIAVSRSLRDELTARRLCRPEKVLVLANGSGQGVDAQGRFNPERFLPETRRRVREQLAIRDNQVVLGFVGRMVRDKGVLELIQLWSALRPSLDVHLLIAGPDNEPRDRVPEDVVARLKADEKVHCIGNVKDIEAYYSAMDMLVFPSRREGFPNAVLEASAMGLPTVAFDVVGSRDAVIDGQTGFLVPPCQMEGLRRRTEELARNAELRRRMGKAAREWVICSFQPEQIYNSLEAIYRQHLSKAGLGPKG